jgi:hypothetical protein
MGLDLSDVNPAWPACVDILTKLAFWLVIRYSGSRLITFLRLPVIFLATGASALEFWLFVLVIRVNDATHLGLAFGVVLPLALAWAAALAGAGIWVWAFFAGAAKLTNAFFAVAVAHLAFALAYGSPLGGVLTALDFALAIGAGVAARRRVPQGSKELKHKQE